MESGNYSIVIHEGDEVDAKSIYVLLNKGYHNCKDWLQKYVHSDKIVKKFCGKRMSIVEGKTKRVFRTTLIKPNKEISTIIEWVTKNGLDGSEIDNLFNIKQKFGTTIGKAKLAIDLHNKKQK